MFPLLLLTQVLVSQEEISPQAVIEKYIEAIGGKEQLEKVETLYKFGTQIIKGDTHELEESIIRDSVYNMNRKFSKGNMSAIVSNGEGVNITPQGIFNMPPDQVSRYVKDLKIFPELAYLKDKYAIKFHGVYELENGTKCYEIGIRHPDSSIVYKEYNIETGLLEMIVNGREKTRIMEYQAVGGILFPSKSSINGLKYESQKIEINAEVNSSDFNWNSKKDLEVIGKWEAQMGTNSNGQEQIMFLELTSDRAGSEGIGLVVDGKKEKNNFLSQSMVGWEFEDSKIKLQYYNPNKRKLWSKYLIIKEKENERIVGYISDPEMDKMFEGEVKPVVLEFKRIKN